MVDFFARWKGDDDCKILICNNVPTVFEKLLLMYYFSEQQKLLVIILMMHHGHSIHLVVIRESVRLQHHADRPFQDIFIVLDVHFEYTRQPYKTT